MIEYCKDIHPRLSQKARSSNFVLVEQCVYTYDICARFIKICHTVHADAQHKRKSHRSRIPCRASLLLRQSCRSSADHARGTLCPTRAARVHKRCHATSMLHWSTAPCQHAHIRHAKRTHTRSLASTAATATLPVRPAHPLPRAPAAPRACDASPPRSRRDRSRASSSAPVPLRPSTKSLLLLPLLLKPGACTRHSQRGIAKVRDTRFYARRQPRTHGRRSHLRCDAPVGSRHADRGRHAAHDHDGDVGYRCALVGLEQDVRGHLRTAPCEQASSGTAGARSRVGVRRGLTACVRSGGRGTVGDIAAQTPAGQQETHQLTTDERGHVQTANKDSKSIALATSSTEGQRRPKRHTARSLSSRAWTPAPPPTEIELENDHMFDMGPAHSGTPRHEQHHHTAGGKEMQRTSQMRGDAQGHRACWPCTGACRDPMHNSDATGTRRCGEERGLGSGAGGWRAHEPKLGRDLLHAAG